MNSTEYIIKALTNKNMSAFDRYYILKNSNKFTDAEIYNIQTYLIKQNIKEIIQEQEEQSEINKGIVQKTIQKAIENVLKDFE